MSKLVKARNIFKIILSILCFLVWILPIGKSYYYEEEESEVEFTYTFIFGNIDVLLFLIPFTLLWFIYQLIKSSKLKPFLGVLTILISVVISLYGIAAIILPIHDFSASIGAFLMVFLFPVTFISLFSDYLIYRRNKVNPKILEDILDA